jgi:hypothetical protein
MDDLFSFLFFMFTRCISANDDDRYGRKCHVSVLVMERGVTSHDQNLVGDNGHQNNGHDGHGVLWQQGEKNTCLHRRWC